MRCEDLKSGELNQNEQTNRRAGASLRCSRGYDCGREKDKRRGANGHKGERIAQESVEPGGWLSRVLGVLEA